jgi:hypothetical protein
MLTENLRAITYERDRMTEPDEHHDTDAESCEETATGGADLAGVADAASVSCSASGCG